MEEAARHEALHSGKHKYAGVWRRFFALVIDMVTIKLLLVIVLDYTLHFYGYSTVAIFTMATMVYGVLFTLFLNQTLGKMIMGIEVISNNGEKLSWDKVMLREVIGKFISISLFLFGYMMAAFDTKKKSLHDHISSTLVIMKAFD